MTSENKKKSWALVGAGLAAFCLSLGVACGHGLRPESVCLFLLGLIVLAFTLGLPIALYGVKKREKYFRPPAFLGFLVMGGLAIASILFTAAMTIGLCEKEAELRALEEGYRSQQAAVEPAGDRESQHLSGEDGSVKITEQQAIAIAERFIADNGYTLAEPDSQPFVRESMVYPWTNFEDQVSSRHNTLEPRAYGTIPACKEEPGWTVAFRRIDRSSGLPEAAPSGERATGRSVTMDEFGRQVMVQHRDVFLDACKHRL